MNNQTNLLFGWKNWVDKNSAAAMEESVAVAVKESLVAAGAVAVAATAVAVEGGYDCCLLYMIYYFIVVDILFYCVKS